MQWERKGKTMAVAMWLLSSVYLGSRFGCRFCSLYCPSSGMVEVSFEQGFVCHDKNKLVFFLMPETERFWKFE